MVARGRPSTSTGNPSASCASTCGVPITSCASRAQAKASSLVPRAPPSTATDDGPAVSIASRSTCAAALSATFQLVATSPSSVRIIGSVSRCSLLTASKPKRPRSQSQLQFTGSLSTPW
ncbi:unannotated protein [freshwater metagenome]|uniref:Unannotated protein n=1 Tax=freshwater metagenome TaxID=449393 RepID=A0A6J6GFN4_9ZZZZ